MGGRDTSVVILSLKLISHPQTAQPNGCRLAGVGAGSTLLEALLPSRHQLQSTAGLGTVSWDIHTHPETGFSTYDL